jgi:hypothetical protein
MALKLSLEKSLISYSLALVFSLAGTAWIMQLWKADLSVPFSYSGDSIAMETLVKSGIDHGWYLKNDSIGLPTGRLLFDYPLSENLHLLFLKAFSLVSSNPFRVLNIYFLLTFPLTTATSLLVLRHFSVSTVPAIVASLLYTFLPFHFMRGLPHIFYSAYYLVPLMTMVCLWTQSESPPFLEGSDQVWWRPALQRLNRKDAAALIICALSGSGGVYYAFFANYLIFIAAATGFIYYRTLKHLTSGLVLVTIITAFLLINTSPSIVYWWSHGPNPEAVNRSPGESEVYGLKISQLLLPVTGHRVPLLAKLKDRYNASAPMTNENDTSTLGIIGSLGFVLLMCELLLRRSKSDATKLLRRLSELNLAAVLLGTMGGLGSLFALLVLPQIRCYNRVSIFIAFFSLFAIAVILDRRWRSAATSTHYRLCLSAGFVALLVVGLADQTSLHFVPPYAAIKAEFDSDERFTKAIEASMPEGSMVFQLPYVPFPENGPVVDMKDYDLFRGYLHSLKLRWSYGATRGRAGDQWQRMVASKPLSELVATVVKAGFTGIYIDRKAFQDHAARLESELKALAVEGPLVSDNGRLAFYKLGPNDLVGRERYR